ncbi:hypothetical protein PAECIP111892_02872 [Paenibacillus auburnensis]|uniref:Uncharacterized protein n=1 Tax=Paenibacillus auburnensis TaxID=2905649 RepID=A0ABM9CAZ4_9BACL|nr:hypothetical protein [Paenibacillus auburnensis]CAH1207388.1 hypothetical protein PAECIP111892_02872 [Paenibacillus auburnensis]
MNLVLFSFVTLAGLLILRLEWTKMKAKKTRDKSAFFTLLLIVWLLSILDLSNAPGPLTFFEAIFRPFRGWLEK